MYVFQRMEFYSNNGAQQDVWFRINFSKFNVYYRNTVRDNLPLLVYDLRF